MTDIITQIKALKATATVTPWSHVSDKIAAGYIKAPDNAALIVALVNHSDELIERVERAEAALKSYANCNPSPAIARSALRYAEQSDD